MDSHAKWTHSELIQFSNLLHRYNFIMRNALHTTIDYGMEESYTSIETHLVLDIEYTPGITVTELSQERSCSKSAITQAINRLEKKGLVQRAKSPENQKTSLLFVTQKGRALTQKHVAFDISNTEQLLNYLSGTYSEKEIRTFFSIIQTMIQQNENNQNL